MDTSCRTQAHHPAGEEAHGAGDSAFASPIRILAVLGSDVDPGEARRTVLEPFSHLPAEFLFWELNANLPAALRQVEADVLLLDISMGEASCFELIRELRARGDHRPMVVLGRETDDLLGEAYLVAGADHYLLTPEATPSSITYGLQTAIAAGRNRESELTRARLAVAIEQVAEGVAITDTLGVALYVNPAFEAIAGHRAEDLVGKLLPIFRPGSSDPELVESIWKTLRAGQTWRGRFTTQRDTAHPVEEEAVISPVRDAAGHIINCVHAWHDVTRLVSLEHQLSQAERLASMGAALAGAAHQVKALLSGLVGSAHLIEQALTRQDLETIEQLWPMYQRNSAHLSDLVENMLDYSRRPRLVLERGDLTQLAREAVSLLGETAQSRGVALELAESVPVPPARFDRASLFDALVAVATNAIDACAETGGTVTVGTVAPEGGGHVGLTVTDDGPGIPAELIDKVFHPFFTTKGKGGTGLGLSIAQKTLVEHGGGIECAFHLFFTRGTRYWSRRLSPTPTARLRSTIDRLA